jgi:hypothetical protein
MPSKAFFNSVSGVAFALGIVLIAAASSVLAAETIDVRVGYSEVLSSDEIAETVIVGNDAVANATIAARNTIVVTGNSIGSTNLILLDEAGAEIFSSTVRVVPVDPRPRHAVRLITGGADESTSVYVCGPEPGCAPGEPEGGGVADAGGAGGPCRYPDDIAADGSRCGDRAASVRPGGVDGEGQPEASPAPLTQE